MSDPYAANVVLHLPLNREAALPELAFDVSAYRNSVSRVGAIMSTTLSKFGNASCWFNGSSYLQLPDSAVYDLLTGDFTVEGWFYPTSLTSDNQVLLNKDGRYGISNSQYGVVLGPTGVLRGIVGSGSGTTYSQLVSGTTEVTLNAWHHYAWERSGTMLLLFLDGVLDASAEQTGTPTSGGMGPLVGYQRGQPAAVYFNGYQDDVRITKGVARYTANFTPPDAIAYSFALSAAKLYPDTALSNFAFPSQRVGQLTAVSGSKDVEFGGNGKIVGTTKNTPALPVSRRVRLHERNSGHLVREGWSDAAGNYSFTHLSRDYTYYVVGFDHTDQYQGVVADKLVPEAM